MATARRNARRSRPTLRERLISVSGVVQRGTHHAVTVSAVLLLLVCAYAAVDALRSQPVERIVVLGKLEHLRESAVRDALDGKLQGGLAFLNLAELRAELEALPWVYGAQLRRRFPGTLEVRVVEQLPIARWGDEAFLNHEARIIEVVDAQRWEDLPRLRGPLGSEARLMNHYLRLLERLRPLSLTPVALSEDGFGQLRATLDGGLVLEFGEHEFSLRLQRFVQLWNRELAVTTRTPARVDLRYEKGAAVAFGSAQQVAGLTPDSENR